MQRPSSLLAVLGMVLVCAGSARCQDDPLLLYRYSPPRHDAQQPSLLGAFVQLLTSSGLIPPGNVPVADGVLVASILGQSPHSVTLTEFRAERYFPREVVVDHAQIVLRVERDPASLRRALQTLLSHYGQVEDRIQEAFELPGQRAAVRYRLRDWPDWLCLEWHFDKQGLTLGVGHGALNQHFSHGPAAESSDVQAHRAAVRGDLKPYLDLYANLAALRASAPTLFRTGRTSPLLRLFEVDQAQSLMIHGRWADSLLAIDLTRSDGQTVTPTALTLDTWPADAGIDKPPGKVHVVAPVQWGKFTRQLLGVATLANEPKDRAGHDALVRGFLDRVGVEPPELMENFRGYLLVSDYPPPWIPVPGAVTLYAVLRDEADAAATQRDFQALMQPLVLPVGSGLSVAHDAASDVYWLDSPLRNVFKAPAWGWAGQRVFVASFSPQAVLANRARLQTTPEP